MFGQTLSPGDFPTILMLVVLEGLLSIDNALVIGLLVRRVDPAFRMKVVSYGLIGAIVLRIGAIAAASYLLRSPIVKLLGGLYLVWICVKYFISGHSAEADAPGNPKQGLWATILTIELTDLAFAVDSILAAIALVGPPPKGTLPDAIHPKLWVVVVGGMLGVVLMRFAAVGFTKLLERFPRLDRSAYLLVLLIGLKLVIDFAVNSKDNPHRIDFEDPHTAALWIFWGAMLISLATGFRGASPSVESAEKVGSDVNSR